jgi:probable addiction module antidote protein
MAKTESYKEQLIKSLKDPESAAHYLTACMEDPDPNVFLLGLRDVAEAQGGLRQLSRRTGLNRENLYRMLSKSGNPAIRSLDSVLFSLGLRLAVEPQPGEPGRARSRHAPATLRRKAAGRASTRRAPLALASRARKGE